MPCTLTWLACGKHEYTSSLVLQHICGTVPPSTSCGIETQPVPLVQFKVEVRFLRALSILDSQFLA